MHVIGCKLIKVSRWFLSGLPACCVLLAVLMSLPVRFELESGLGHLVSLIPILFLVAEPAFLIGLVLLVIGLLCRRFSTPPTRPVV